jgi:hypothetical protein
MLTGYIGEVYQKVTDALKRKGVPLSQTRSGETTGTLPNEDILGDQGGSLLLFFGCLGHIQGKPGCDMPAPLP